MVEYKKIDNRCVEVRFDSSKRLVGRIKAERKGMDVGWRYWVARSKMKGDWFNTLNEVKKSLECD